VEPEVAPVEAAEEEEGAAPVEEMPPMPVPEQVPDP